MAYLPCPRRELAAASEIGSATKRPHQETP